METSSSELFEINISNKLTFLGFIDEQRHSWILFKTFFNALSQVFKEHYQHYSPIQTVYNNHVKIVKSINPDLLQTAVIKKIHLRKNNISQNFRLGPYILIDKDFFINQYLEKGFDNFFWGYFKENYKKNELYYTVAKRLGIASLARDKINDLFAKKLASDKNIDNITIANNSAIDDNTNTKLFDNDKLSDDDSNKNITINADELNSLIVSAIEKSIPKIVDSVADILLTAAPGAGTKHYYADKITTIQPNTDQYFCIRDFLIEKNASLIFLKLFGGLVASHYGNVAIKYLPPNSNSNKAGYNYYPIKYKPLIEKLFSNFIETVMPKNQAKEAVL